MSPLQITQIVLSFLLGLSLGSLITLYKLYITTKSTITKLTTAMANKIHDIDFMALWQNLKSFIDNYIKEKEKGGE